jgi:hypothetical protein
MHWTDNDISRLRHAIGDIDDSKLTAILALAPSYEEVLEAVALVEGDSETLGKGERWLSGKVGAIFEILVADVEDELRLLH